MLSSPSESMVAIEMYTLLSFSHAWNLLTQVLVECYVLLFLFLSLNLCKCATVALVNANVEVCGRRCGFLCARKLCEQLLWE